MGYGVNMEVMLEGTETDCWLWCKHGNNITGSVGYGVNMDVM